MDKSIRPRPPMEREPVKSKSTLLPMARPARRGNCAKGRKIQLLTNHFNVKFHKPRNPYLFQYSVAVTYQDGSPVEANGIFGRKILRQVQETYHSYLGYKHFAYDGGKSLFTVGPLPRSKLDFYVVLEEMSSRRNAAGTSDDTDMKKLRRPNQSKKFNVAISYAAKTPIQAIANALQGKETNYFHDAIRVLDAILCQNAANQGCLLVHQSFFHNDAKYFANIGEGLLCCKGFHSSFRTTQRGLTLNLDVSSTIILKPGPVIDFLLENQSLKNPSSIDWEKAKKTLRKLRVKVTHLNREYKITGLSGLLCKDETFTWNKRNGNGEVEDVDITVFDYYTKILKINLRYSGDLRCINVGKPNRPTYFPIELCELVSLQRYTRALTKFQRTNLVNESRLKPHQNMDMLSTALKNSKYNDDPILQDCGVTIGSSFTKVEGRVLPTPKLKGGNGQDIRPQNGRWNFYNKKVVEPARVTKWAVVNFSARCDPHKIVLDLIRCGKLRGINIDDPMCATFEEDHRVKNEPGSERVNKMFELIKSKLFDPPKFMLCILPGKNNDVYGPWKKKTLVQFGIVNQCIVPPATVNELYLANVLLKINAKLGGLNSVLDMEQLSRDMPSVMRVPTMIIGMDVSHGPPGQSGPSIAAVVSSREWPLVSKYRACVRTQSSKVEMIDNLFNRVSNNDDEGIMRELLGDFESSCRVKPCHIIIFRDGVSETQFNQVLNIELDQIMKACKFLDEKWNPKFTVIVAQKKHHTKFYQTISPDNVPPGTIIDSGICHPHNNDFYLCAHAGRIGTSRPTHYHVLYDEIGFEPDDLQELVHSLSYVYQRSTTAVSQVAPICYAHLAAAQMATAMRFEDMPETSSIHSGITTVGAVPVPTMPKLNSKVASSMFFC